MSFPRLNAAEHKALDRQLLNLIQELTDSTSYDALKASAIAIVNSAEQTLVRDTWQSAWANLGCVVTGWFGDLKRDKVAMALYDVMTELVRIAAEEDPTTDEQQDYRRDLTKALRRYLERRGHAMHPVPMQAAASASNVRPSEPTRDYCLVPPNKIRWMGEKEVEQRLWHILGCVLESPTHRISHADVEQYAYNRDVQTKTIRNDVSTLNSHLIDVGFPWTLTAAGGFVQPKK